MPAGLFITLEGGDGAGKSTQARLIAESLESRGLRVLLTREVGGAVGAEAVRDLWLSKPQGYWDPMTEVLLIMAARREHLVKTVWPALDRGVCVVSDRFVDSTRAYQGVGLGLGVEKIDALYRSVVADRGDFWPDLTLVLDLQIEEGLRRMNARTGPLDRYEERDVAFHQTLRFAFLDLAAREPKRMAVVNAMEPPDAVAQRIGEHIDALLQKP